MLSPSVFHPFSLPPANSKPVFPSVLSSSFLPRCHLNYWPILCSLPSLSLFPSSLPQGLKLVSPHLFQGCRCCGFSDICRFVCFYHHTPLLLFSCLSLHFPLSAYPSQSIIMSSLCLSPSFPTEAIIINHAGRCMSSGQ